MFRNEIHIYIILRHAVKCNRLGASVTEINYRSLNGKFFQFPNGSVFFFQGKVPKKGHIVPKKRTEGKQEW